MGSTAPAFRRLRGTAFVLGLLSAAYFGYTLAARGLPGAAARVGDTPATPLLGMLVAGVLLTFALVEAPDDTAEETGARHGLLSHRLELATLALLALALALVGYAAWLLWSDGGRWAAALPFWLAGLAVAVGGPLVVGAAARQFAPPRLGLRSLPVILAVIAVIALAVVLLVYRLGEVPPAVFLDETNGAIEAAGIARGLRPSPFATGWYQLPSGYMYFEAFFVKILGPTFAALKLPGILTSALTVLGTFLLGRLLFGTPAGLVASALLAFARWPLTMGRWGWIETAPAAVIVWSLYFLVRGTRSGRLADYALGGLILGLGMYTYLSIRLALVAITLYLIYRLVVERGFLRRSIGGVAVFGLVWAITFLPLAVTYARNPSLFTGRTDEVTIAKDVAAAGGRLDPVVENARRHLLMFNIAGDRNARHNIPGKPMLDPIMGSLFLLAAVRGLLLLRDHRRGLLLLWISTVLLGGILSALAEGPQAFRTLGVMPAVALLCGELAVACGRTATSLLRAARWPDPIARSLPTAALGVALAASAWLNLAAYFGEYAADRRVYDAFGPLETAVVQEWSATPDVSTYYLSPRLYYSSVVRYFTFSTSRGKPGEVPAPAYHLFQGYESLVLDGDGSADLTVLLDPEWWEYATLLKRQYPEALAETVAGRYGEALYRRLTVPAQPVRESRGLIATCIHADGQEERLRVGDPSAGVPRDCARVEWVGSLLIPASGPREIRAADGAPLSPDARSASGMPFLPKGLLPIRLTQSGAQARQGLELTWRDGKGAPPVVVPQRSFFTLLPEREHGLLATYYSGERWEGVPLFRRVEPLIAFAWSDPEPVPGAFSTTWEGFIDAPSSGQYAFSLDADDGVRLWLDGEVVGEALKRNTGNGINAMVTLTAGAHRIRVDYFQVGGAKGITMWWRPPGQPRSVVMPDVLHPPGR